MRGRKPTPLVMLKLSGSRRAEGRRAGELGRPAKEPKGDSAGPTGKAKRGGGAADATRERIVIRRGELPEPPNHLDAVGRERWRELLAVLVEIGSAMVLDLDHLGAYCQAYSWWVRASKRLITGKGLVETHVNGSVGPGAWTRIVVMALERMDKSGAELGLSPTARARLKMEIETQQDDLLDWITGGGRARVPATKG